MEYKTQAVKLAKELGGAKAAAKYGIRQGINSAGGRCHDNARCESMWARMKGNSSMTVIIRKKWSFRN